MKKQIALIVLLMALVNFANAFKVSPVKLELSIPRGQTREIVLTLSGSKGANIENLMVYPTDLSVSKTGVYTFKRIENSKFSAVPWIKIDDTKISLNEAQTKTLKFKISVPMNANPGEYYSIIMIEPEKNSRMSSKEKPLAMDYKVRIGVVLILDVPGRVYAKTGKALATEMISITPELIQQIKIETMSGRYDGKHELFYALPDLEKMANKTLILGSFQNFGNTHLYVSGTAIVRSKDKRLNFGQTKLMAMGNTKEQVFTFPGDERFFIGIWDKQLPKGEYIIDVVYDYGDKIRKATAGSDFSISRELNEDESKNEFLVLDSKIAELKIPIGALRTRVVKVSNTDYRTINVSAMSEDWIKVEPKNFTLQPGQSMNVKTTISIAGYKQPIMETKIIFQPDRGMPSELKIQIKEK